MRTRPIGRGLHLTEIGFGAAQIGNLHRAVDDDTAHAAVDAAWEAGIRYFDTAPHYGLGLSERRLGAALQARPREQYVLSTKVGRLLVEAPESANRMDDDGFVVSAGVRRQWDFSRDGVRRSVEESLERLGLDYLDIAYLHDPDDHWEAASTTGVAALAELRDEGVIRAFGAGMNQAGMLADFVERCDVDVVMVAGRYTLLDAEAADRLLPLAAQRGVAVVAAAVYNSGLLSARRPRPDARYDYAAAPEHLVRRAQDIAEVVESRGADLPSAALAWPLRRPEVASVVVGLRTPEHVRSTLERYRTEVSAESWDELMSRGLVGAAPAVAAEEDPV